MAKKIFLTTYNLFYLILIVNIFYSTFFDMQIKIFASAVGATSSRPREQLNIIFGRLIIAPTSFNLYFHESFFAGRHRVDPYMFLQLFLCSKNGCPCCYMFYLYIKKLRILSIHSFLVPIIHFIFYPFYFLRMFLHVICI